MSDPDASAAAPGTDRFPLAAVHVALFLLGALLGLYGAFLVPVRLADGVEGVSLLLAVVGNFAVGLGAARLTRSLPTSATPGVGWVVAVLVMLSVARPHDEVVIPGRLGGDPGVAVVGSVFLFAGLAGSVAAVLLANRLERRDNRRRTLDSETSPADI